MSGGKNGWWDLGTLPHSLGTTASRHSLPGWRGAPQLSLPQGNTLMVSQGFSPCKPISGQMRRREALKDECIVYTEAQSTRAMPTRAGTAAEPGLRPPA